jgi:hypothetical protein
MIGLLRQIYKGIAYCHYHPEDKLKKEMLDSLILKAWDLGYPRTYFDKPNNEIPISDMTEWEINYSLKDIS